jgi:hypothetical protein
MAVVVSTKSDSRHRGSLTPAEVRRGNSVQATGAPPNPPPLVAALSACREVLREGGILDPPDLDGHMPRVSKWGA